MGYHSIVLEYQSPILCALKSYARIPVLGEHSGANPKSAQTLYRPTFMLAATVCGYPSARKAGKQ